jgi:hypothetical protein
MVSQTSSKPTNELSLSLSRVLYFDAATCAAMGALLVIAGEWLGALLNLPASFLRATGLILFPCAALMAYTASRRPPSAALVRLIIWANALWVVASVLVMTVFLAPNAVGQAFILVQALAVAGLAALEHLALKGILR